MFAVRSCNHCRRVLKRSDCFVDPEGLFDPEMLCPHCDGLVRARLSAFGWIVALATAVALGVAVCWLQVGV
jgi:hypothetical protein